VSNDIIFKKSRKTATGTIIIDIIADTIQTCWLQIVDDMDETSCICVNNTTINNTLINIDNTIIEHVSKAINLTTDEVKKMYNCLFKFDYLILRLSPKTVLFHNNECYDKDNIKNYVTKNDYARFIISLKKISIKNQDIDVSIELLQVEI
jgi:hypothetical protein